MILSKSLRDFLAQHIQAVEDIDVLMLVRSAPEKEWSALEISEHLRIDPISAANRLIGLSLQGLLRHRDRSGRLYNFRYAAPRPVERIAAELADVYQKHREEIHEYVVRNQREQMIALANAFRFKKQDP